MANQITGRIYRKIEREPIQGSTGETVRNAELWITPFYFDRYTGQLYYQAESKQMISIEFTGRMADQTDAFQEGCDVTISYDLRGRLYKDRQNGEEKCFTTVSGRFIQSYPPTPGAR